jgi:hypothetical protein
VGADTFQDFSPGWIIELQNALSLKATYMAAWRGLGWRWQAVLEG